ncbi:phosphate ABC transporter substrate-binding protein, partial [Vibrio parahaemolyticus]|nr:phosphate ABC transporter substrate-binding protein [Vibrio parahaemolyticus]
MGRRVSRAIACIALTCSSMAVAQDKPLSNYHKTTGIVGNLLSVGSDTLAGMTTLWVEEFKSIYPNINAQVQASGSSTAPPALT